MTLRVTFLGTSAAVPTTGRNPSGIFVNRDGDRLLFDVGEGTQRQMMRYGTGFGVSDVFITHLHGDHVLGLPGLLQTWDFSERTDPLTIHTSRRTRQPLEQFLFALEQPPSYPVTINEVAAGEVVCETEEYRIESFETDHDTRSLGYTLIEEERKGRFDRSRAEELGVPVGPKFSRLHRGEAVELDDGTVVEPDQVVGSPRPGRRIVYTGDTRPTENVRSVAANADLLIHEATFTSERRERAKETAHSTARQAARIAADANVSQLALTHISSRYAGDSSDHATEASEVFDGRVHVAHDGLELEIPLSET